MIPVGNNRMIPVAEHGPPGQSIVGGVRRTRLQAG